jgi:putative hydrolase of the HAD superfamily
VEQLRHTLGRVADRAEVHYEVTEFKVMSFDCYGTLIDWETGMFKALQPLVSRVRRPLSRNEVLKAHARHESAQQLTTPTRPYKELLAVVYKRLAEEWGVPASWDECIAYGLSVRNWPPFLDSADALQYLRKHYKLVILSNVDNESFSFSNKKLQVQFDAIFTAGTLDHTSLHPATSSTC